MEHLAFYNVGCEPASGLAGLKILPRRLLRKLLLPASKRLVQILSSLADRLNQVEPVVRDLRAEVDELRRRQDEVADKFPTTVAFGWDYVAMVRRLAVLEEHVADLLDARDAVAEPPPPATVPAPLAQAG